MDTQKEQQLIKDYVNGMKLTELFKKYHTSYETVVKILDREQIDHSRSGRKKGIPNPKNRRTITPEEEELVCKVYRETGRASDCEKAIKSSQGKVREILKKYGLYRTPSQAICESPQNQRKYPVKDDFFDTQSPDMAYILGFIAADGTVRKGSNEIKIGLSSVDREILEKFKVRIGGREIKDYTTQKGFEVSSWCFTSKHIKEELAEYNIVPNKTFSFNFPQKLKEEYYRDFIRGYFDGDGCISSAGPSAIRFQICAATKDVLEKIVAFFKQEGIPAVEIYVDKKREHPSYYFQYSSVPTRAIYDILYYEGCLCLQRKRKKYEELLYKNLKK